MQALINSENIIEQIEIAKAQITEASVHYEELVGQKPDAFSREPEDNITDMLCYLEELVARRDLIMGMILNAHGEHDSRLKAAAKRLVDFKSPVFPVYIAPSTKAVKAKSTKKKS